MFSKKKRASSSDASAASKQKKARTGDDASTSEEGKAGGGVFKKQAKAKKVQALPKTEDPVPHTLANVGIPDWPEADLKKKMKRKNHRKNNLPYDSWSHKLVNRHPEMPTRPPSAFMFFYSQKREAVARENPCRGFISNIRTIMKMYESLPEKKKQRYIDIAAVWRQEYEQKMKEFYREHPELIPKPVPSKEQRGSMEIVPVRTPFELFFALRKKRHENESDFNRAEFLEKCKDQWKNMSDKKKVVWINWALEQKKIYKEQLKTYMSENPSFVPSNIKAILTKEEKHLRERYLKYQDELNQMLDQYKLKYGASQESLPGDKRQEELENNQPRRKAAAKTAAEKPLKKNKHLDQGASQHLDQGASQHLDQGASQHLDQGASGHFEGSVHSEQQHKNENGSSEQDIVDTSVLTRGYHFLGRVVRAIPGIQVLMLLLLGVVPQVPIGVEN